MKLEKIIYTIREIEKSNGLDSRYDDRMIIDMINRYREVNIRNYYEAFKDIKDIWFQNLGVITPQVVNSADDLQISHTSVAFGKYTLPKIIEIPNTRTLQLRSASKHQRIEAIDSHILFKMIEVNDPLLSEFTTYFKESENIYIYPVGTKVITRVILFNPLEGYTNNALVLPDGTISSEEGVLRNLTILDEYPCDGQIISMLIIDILTKELKIEKSAIADTDIDSAETDELLKSKM